MMTKGIIVAAVAFVFALTVGILTASSAEQLLGGVNLYRRTTVDTVSPPA